MIAILPLVSLNGFFHYRRLYRTLLYTDIFAQRAVSFTILLRLMRDIRTTY